MVLCKSFDTHKKEPSHFKKNDFLAIQEQKNTKTYKIWHTKYLKGLMWHKSRLAKKHKHRWLTEKPCGYTTDTVWTGIWWTLLYLCFRMLTNLIQYTWHAIPLFSTLPVLKVFTHTSLENNSWHQRQNIQVWIFSINPHLTLHKKITVFGMFLLH